MKRWDRSRLFGFVTDTGGTFVRRVILSLLLLRQDRGDFFHSYWIKGIFISALVSPIKNDIHHAVDLPNPSLYLANVFSLLTL